MLINWSPITFRVNDTIKHDDVHKRLTALFVIGLERFSIQCNYYLSPDTCLLSHSIQLLPSQGRLWSFVILSLVFFLKVLLAMMAPQQVQHLLSPNQLQALIHQKQQAIMLQQVNAMLHLQIIHWITGLYQDYAKDYVKYSLSLFGTDRKFCN